MADPQNLITVSGVSKAFPGVIALEGVEFTLRKGEIHALMGENGAGKSTLIKILTGVEQPDTGRIELENSAISIRSPQHAQDLGISTVYQEINLCTNISVAENIMLGHEPRRFGGIHWKKLNELARQALARLGIELDVTQPLGIYSIAIQQMVAIARALAIASAKVLILDEPTSSLDANETARLFAVMRSLKQAGIGIVFVTHFLDQVYEIVDRVTILRNGRFVGSFEIAALSRVELVAKMLGRVVDELQALAHDKDNSAQQTDNNQLIKASGLGLRGALEPLDLTVGVGEVLGIAGLLGSGRTELASLLFGIATPDSGSLVIDGQPVTRFSPQALIKRGVALCPEDRKAEGIVGELSIRENIILGLQGRYGWFKFIGRQKQTEIAEKYIKLLGIRTPSPDQLVKNLSGGNQQKVILARWLVTQPRLLILDEPTRGIDVGAKAEIQKLVLELVKDGMSIVFISSELEEVVRISDRIVVLRDHAKVAEYDHAVSDRTLMQTMAGEA
ncbi:sugar ABC transporter ATP-binding protein [Herpetosiphon giganteus]|uniref:sugar ABC transporter ATP-binding protein n=1 Tax=Herpetosiphon giganteus TaxID=2029754 RepID=UPI00195C4305|nr:sugar ABC transporter ATP-binding protein [Herpetosiphon giganteus]MBM7845713.1 simple sugar transport system ATP-binding protein [Herpetosiphon giganteus]